MGWLVSNNFLKGQEVSLMFLSEHLVFVEVAKSKKTKTITLNNQHYLRILPWPDKGKIRSKFYQKLLRAAIGGQLKLDEIEKHFKKTFNFYIILSINICTLE